MHIFSFLIVGLTWISLCSCNDIPGGETPQDITDPKYLLMAKESLAKYKGYIDESLKIRLLKVLTQVVSGLKTKLDFEVYSKSDGTYEYQCHSEIVEQPWLEKKMISVNCDEDENKKKNKGLYGREVMKDPTNPKYEALVRESLKNFPPEARMRDYALFTIDKVTEQLVAGLLTRIDFALAGPFGSRKVYQCRYTLWEKAWLNKKDITVVCD